MPARMTPIARSHSPVICTMDSYKDRDIVVTIARALRGMGIVIGI